ncbi:MAG: tRNA (adenosine(37)-N6)-threonylcarbamoyltransferase complex ATPase subunit type 1 TsaE [Rhodobacteraceae bacterium]|nr:tRNA (adenosine(37)-N6)-threonylcarbamoyltransferase complex ATPase subunit type 1 TsaE [Paracoccaceae bacterium]
MRVTLPIKTPEQTADLAKQVGGDLGPGDCLLLSGPVGAGKTHFARHLIWSLLKTPEDVPSPTFTLVQTYETDLTEVWHADLYRLNALNEIEELGLADAMETAICLIEWPELLGPLTPPQALKLTFRPDQNDENARLITLESTADRWTALLGDLAHDS